MGITCGDGRTHDRQTVSSRGQLWLDAQQSMRLGNGILGYERGKRLLGPPEEQLVMTRARIPHAVVHSIRDPQQLSSPCARGVSRRGCA